jgi:predicted ATPase/DNA-binding SARP family transcriptional activator
MIEPDTDFERHVEDAMGIRQPNATTDEAANPARLTARLLGVTEMWVGDRALGMDVWPRRTARALLILLLSKAGHQLRRDEVLETLWPELSPDAALNELYKALHALRRVLEPELQRGSSSSYVRVANEIIALAPDLTGEIDIVRFEQARKFEAGSDPRIRLRNAIEHYSGDFLADDPYSEWPVARRELLRAAWQNAVLDLAELDLAAGEADASRAALTTLLVSDPAHESAHRALIRLYIATGRHDAARRQYATCVEMLRRELDVEPDPETAELFASIPKHAAEIASSPALTAPPVPPTRLVGRSIELDAIQELLSDDQIRIVTLTGPGGIGKTHLALAASAYLEAEFRDGVAFAGLSAIRDPAGVLPEIGRSLGGIESDSPNLLERIAQSLTDRELLLVIDNVEQVIDAAADIAELLARARGLTLLATSRERLRIRGEHVIEVGPLAVPDPARTRSPEAIAQFDSVRLYLDRVRDRQRDFTVSAENAGAIAAICQRLDGIPLAIELIAVQNGSVSPVQLARQLESRLDLLVDGPRDLPDRLRTMRNAIAWSYDLLSPEERLLAMRASIFSDGMTEDTVSRLVRELGDNPSSISALLSAFVEKNLVRLDTLPDPPRYRMLETIREFGIEQLHATHEHDRATAAHCSVYADLLTNLDAELVGQHQVWWYDWVQAEHQNIRLALEHAIDHRQAQTAMAMAGAIWRFWSTRGYCVDGLKWLERAIGLDEGPVSEARAIALRSAGRLAEDLTDYEKAETYQRQALAAWTELGDINGTAIAYDDLGSLAHNRGEFDRADQLHLESLKLSREAKNTRVMMSALSNLGASAWRRGDHERAFDYFTQAHDIATDPLSIALMTANRGVAAMGLGRVDDALAFAEESLRLWKHVGSKRGVADALLNLADPQQRLGDLDEAKKNSGEALAIYEEIGEQYGTFSALHTLAVTARLAGAFDESLEFLRRGLAIVQDVEDRPSLAMFFDDFALTFSALGKREASIACLAAANQVRIAFDTRRGFFEHREYVELLAKLDIDPSPLSSVARSIDDLIGELLA